MTTTEHLQRIRDRCVELLAIAEKRTAGWSVEHGAVKDPMAEAGWRSTIAAIDFIVRRIKWGWDGDRGLSAYADSMESSIIAAWPEELL